MQIRKTIHQVNDKILLAFLKYKKQPIYFKVNTQLKDKNHWQK